MVTHQLQVESRTGNVCHSKTNVLPLCHATNKVLKCLIRQTAKQCDNELSHDSLRYITRRRVTSLPSSNRRATLVIGSVYARHRRPSSMFLAPNMWPSVAVRLVQLQLKYGTVYQGQCSLPSHWTFFDATWKLNCSSVLTTDIAPVKRLYCCVTHFHFPAAFCCGCNLEVYRL